MTCQYFRSLYLNELKNFVASEFFWFYQVPTAPPIVRGLYDDFVCLFLLVFMTGVFPCLAVLAQKFKLNFFDALYAVLFVLAMAQRIFIRQIYYTIQY